MNIDNLRTFFVNIFSFNEKYPLLFTQFNFWAFFALVFAVFSLCHSKRLLRNGFLFFASLFFYYKTSGLFVLILVFDTLLNYSLGLIMGHSQRKGVRKGAMIVGVVVSLLVLFYFKYAYFFTDTYNTIVGSQYEVINWLAQWSNELTGTSYFDASKILLPVGISFYTFQNISYVVDVYKGRAQYVGNILDFGFYVSFFPQLVAGPIIRADQFVPQLYKKFFLSRRQFGIAVFWILNGLAKKLILSDYLAVNFVDRVFNNPTLFTSFENLSALFLYSLQVYADFSGYTDIAIGVAMLMGFYLPKNFDSPYKADSPSNFWKRWLFKALFKRSPNMDSLIALGSSAGFIYSTYSLFKMTSVSSEVAMSILHNDLYFESSAMILALITIGKTLESFSKGKTTNALKSLMNLQAKTVKIIKDGKEITIPTEQISVGDEFVVYPGESIAVDGVILSGESAIDESSLTGESVPIDKAVGDKVSSGTINKSGFLRCKALKVGEDTTISQIIKMVNDAASSKAPIAKIADKVSGIFVPIVIAIAIITFIGWLIVGQPINFSLSRAISVLVISCPCALGLATPVAIMVGNGIGAKNGILFKNATALENLGKVNIVALDKTGTITKGEPTVTDIISLSDDLLKIAFSLEKQSEHPLAKAITSYCEQNKTEVFETESFKEIAGNGISAKINNVQYFGGSYKFISKNIKIDNDTEKTINELTSKGKTPLLFANEKQLVGIIAVADTIKQDSPNAIKQLQKMGIKVVMLTGDNKQTANIIAKQSGVDEVFAEVLPDGKKQIIDKLKQNGKVLMVGDGINDAPALSAADSSVAIGAGTDVAVEAADIVIVKSVLSDLVKAITISKLTIRNIHENLFWAFIYNVIGIPLAIGLFINLFGWQLNPMFGAAAMSLSSFCVVTNALRLNLYNLEKKRFFKKNTVKEQDIMEKTVKIEGMMCEHCEAHIKKALENLDEVISAQVSHKDGTAKLNLSKEIDDEAVKQAVENEGYKYIG